MNVDKTIQSAFEHHRNGKLKEAESCYRKALKKQPDNPNVLHMLGVLFCQLADYDSAIKYIRKALQFRPADIASAHCNLGVALQEKGEFDEAIAHYQKAIGINPSFAKAHSNLANALHHKGQIDEAIAHYQKAIEINPFFAKAHSNLGNALREKDHLDEAVAHCQKAIELDPSFAEAYNNLGATLRKKGEPDEAITNCLKAIELNPSFAEAYNNLGNALQEKGRPDEAVAYYLKALELNPDYETANFNLALISLLSGNFREGWEQYERRWREKDFLKRSCSHKPGDFSQPAWDGSSLEGRSLLVYAEQGVGDEIMFASCFQDVIAQAGACTVECDKRLVPIFSRSFPEAAFIERKGTDACSSGLPRTDRVIPMGSLPKFLRRDLDAFPRRSYLVPDADKVAVWHNRFQTLGEGLKIGISWRGGRVPSVIRKRSLTLEQWAGIFSFPGAHFINLQYGDCKKEIREAEESLKITIHDWEDADPLKDLDHFAAEIAAVDLVLSVDNSTVHMAGALGKPVWVLLSYVPDWRWMLNREDSPWYPKMRLFRQPSAGDWRSVIAQVLDEMQG